MDVAGHSMVAKGRDDAGLEKPPELVQHRLVWPDIAP